MKKLVLLITFFSSFACLSAQDEVPLYSLWWDGSAEYLVQIDPYTATHTIVDELPGIEAVALGSSTMISGTKLYVFKGQSQNGFDIVFVNTQNGDIVNQVPAANYPSDFFTELEYDLQSFQMWGLQTNLVTDTIITIDSLTNDTMFQTVNSMNSLVSVDVANGTVGVEYPILGTDAILVNSSTFNSNDGHYIYVGIDNNYDKRLYTIDVNTGLIVSNPIVSLGNAELHYDNTLDKLYGLGRSSENTTFDPVTGEASDTLVLFEIDPLTAAKTTIADYPSVSGIVLGGTAYISDSSQYVFSGVAWGGSKKMYVTDVSTGQIVSQTAFTENYIELQIDEFEFSQKLYNPSVLELDLSMLIEGAYENDGSMNNLANGVLPLTQPFAVAPYNYLGTEILDNVPADMVDWVLVELRTGTPNMSGAPGTSVAATKAAVLKTNGKIVGLDGAPLRFEALPEAEAYYIAVRHRSHLDVLSAMAVATEGLVEYDFTTGVDKAFGTAQLKPTNDGKAMMYSGDYNQDGTIQTTDVDVWQANPAVINSYGVQDGNLDGVIQVTDYDVWFLNKSKIGSVEIGY